MTRLLSRCLRWVGRVFKRKPKTLEPVTTTATHDEIMEAFRKYGPAPMVVEPMVIHYDADGKRTVRPLSYWQKRPEGKQ